MYSVTVRGHMMIAHSFRGEVFGPARRLHGATYVVDVEFRRADLDADGIVVDIGRATTSVHAILEALKLPQPRRRGDLHGPQYDDGSFSRAMWFDRLVAAIRSGELGDNGPRDRRHQGHPA
jgi:hypothetical protein